LLGIIIGREEGQLAAKGVCNPGSQVTGGYSEFKEVVPGTNWKTDLSQKTIKTALDQGMAPFGNARARCVVWNFPDQVPIHREPLHSPRADLVEKYPTYEDKPNHYRVLTRYKSEQKTDLAKEYPYVLTSGYRQPFYFLGQYRNIPWLRSFMVYPTAQINPETAKKHGIEDGDWIWIESPRGRIRQLVRVYPGIDPRVVMATANCFYPEEPGPLHGLTISSPNMLTSNEHFDPMYGSPDLTCLLCRISKVEEKDMKDIPRGAYRLQGYEGDIGTVPFGQDGKVYGGKR